MSRLLIALIAGGAALGACDRNAEPPANDMLAPANETAAASNVAAAPPAPEPGSASQESARVYTLAGNGLEPGLAFGLAQREVVAAATAAFGAPTGTERNDECGEGPMDFVNFGGLALGFQEGRFAGWSLSERRPPLRTAGGLAIGAPRSALGGAEIDRDSSLGPEFSVADVGGLLDEHEREVIALWAGLPCQFR